MSDLKIRQLFESRLAAWASARTPKLPVAYEDRSFAPPENGGSYIKAYLMPATTDSEDLEGKHTTYHGIFQLSLVTKAGGGRGIPGLIAEEIQALYPNNLELRKSGFSVFIRSPMSSAAAIQGDITSTLPLSFQYRADTFT